MKNTGYFTAEGIKIGNLDYKPKKKVVLSTINSRVEIRTDGGIYAMKDTSTSQAQTNYIALDGLSFYLE